MNGLITLFLILMPMFIGFALPHHHNWVSVAERSLNYLIFLILIVIGIELGLVEDLGQKIGSIILYLSTLTILTIGLGTASLIIFDKIIPPPKHIRQNHNNKPTVSLHGSLIQISCLAIGFILARVLPEGLLPPHNTTTVLLMALLFLVGVSLKGSGITLKEAMLNKRGLQISIIFAIATLLSGIFFALIFKEVTIFKGLALASGFGWYSLSGTVMTDAYGAIWGSVALLNDLSREVIALIFIPWIMRHSQSAAIGLGGVTSLDFTLPTLTQAGGTQIIPVVISFGFITNVISPVFMVFFSALG